MQGTLDLLILRRRPSGPHGLAIAQAIEHNQGTFSGEARLAVSGAPPPEEARLDLPMPKARPKTTGAPTLQADAKGRKQLDIETSKWDKLARGNRPHPPPRRAGG